MCLAAGIRLIDIAELMGHRDVKTTLTVYAHLINTDDHTGNMAVLGALATPAQNRNCDNVIPLHAESGVCGPTRRRSSLVCRGTQNLRRRTTVEADQRHDPSEKNGE